MAILDPVPWLTVQIMAPIQVDTHHITMLNPMDTANHTALANTVMDLQWVQAMVHLQDLPQAPIKDLARMAHDMVTNHIPHHQGGPITLMDLMDLMDLPDLLDPPDKLDRTLPMAVLLEAQTQVHPFPAIMAQQQPQAPPDTLITIMQTNIPLIKLCIFLFFVTIS